MARRKKQIAAASEHLEPFFAGASVKEEKKIAKAADYYNYADRGSARLGNSLSAITDGAKYRHILDKKTPYSIDDNHVSIQEAVELCRKAYFGFPLLYNIINVMTEFSVGQLYLEGANQTARDFIEAWLDRIGYMSLQDRFYRELYRSSNNFILRVDGTFEDDYFKKLTQTYGAKSKTIPLRYTILDPACIRVGNCSTFEQNTYYKVFNGYELQRLKDAKTPEDQAILEALSPEDRKNIKAGTCIYMPLDSKKMTAVFFKKQDYEPFAIPMAWPSLDLIEMKLILLEMDKSLSGAADWAILHFKVGDEKTGFINPQTIKDLRQIFETKSIKRTLTTDYTVKGEWLIPSIADILGKEKYEEVNNDLIQGLNAFLFASGEKFANQSTKVNAFIERIKQVREMFLAEFLQPEVKRICKDMGFKNFPIIKYNDIDLRDQSVYARVYAQLAQMGFLAPNETINAIKDGHLPTQDESEFNQRRFKSLKDEELYAPVVTSAPAQEENRPTGTKGTPKSSNKVGPLKASYNSDSILKNLTKANQIYAEVESKLLKQYKLKELNQDQISIARELTASILINEKNHKKAIAKYIQTPIEISDKTKEEIEDIANEHGFDLYLGTVMYLSKERE